MVDDVKRGGIFFKEWRETTEDGERRLRIDR